MPIKYKPFSMDMTFVRKNINVLHEHNFYCKKYVVFLKKFNYMLKIKKGISYRN